MARVSAQVWDAVQAEYAGGLLSLREIGKRYHLSESTIRAKAKKERWQQSLVNDLRKEIEARDRATAEDELKSEGTAEYETAQPTRARAKLPSTEIVDALATRQMLVAETHRKAIRESQSLCHHQKARLKASLDAIEGVASPSELKSLSSALVDIARAETQWIQAERKAFGLDKVDKAGDEPDAGVNINISIGGPSSDGALKRMQGEELGGMIIDVGRKARPEPSKKPSANVSGKNA